jgi:hypothetical protein
MPACRLTLPLITAIAAFTFITGCAAPPPKVVEAPAPVPVSADQAQAVQAAISTTGAVVGHVSGINGTLAAVSFTPPIPKLKAGDSIQFMDSRSMGIANGQYVSTDVTNPQYPVVIVEFEPTTAGRAPISGDLAIYTPPATH